MGWTPAAAASCSPPPLLLPLLPSPPPLLPVLALMSCSPFSRSLRPCTHTHTQVQLVGYGTDPVTGLDYFTIRNSWTPLWGENGFMRLLRSKNASCGVDLRPGDGDGCKGGPKQVKVCGQSGILYDGVFPLV